VARGLSGLLRQAGVRSRTSIPVEFKRILSILVKRTLGIIAYSLFQ
jgi:hypothetical protein